MGERNWYARYKAAREYADEQAARYQRGEELSSWTYETDYKPGMPEPKKITLTGASWVAHAYAIAAEDAQSLVHTNGEHWQTTVDECNRLAEEYRKQGNPS